jgi:hypothetical protein
MAKRLAASAVLLAALAGCGGSGNAGNNAAANGASGGAAQVVTTPPAGPEGAIFAEYDRACRNLADVEALKTAAAANGWEQYQPEPDSQAGTLLAFAETNVRPLLQGAEFNNAAYRKTAGGRQLVLIVTEIPTGPAKSSECRVYDFDAADPPSDATVATWTTNPPTSRTAQQGLTLWQWTPGFRDGLTQQTVIHMDADSPLRQEIPAVGLAITATLGAASRE